MMIRWAGKSHVGLKRRINEDRILMAPELGLYAIADGVGGQRAGEVASRLAVGAIEDYWRKFRGGERPTLLRPVEEPLSETAKHLINAIAFANRVINEAQKKPAYYGMGSTVAVVAEESETLWVANVGDSRVYLFHQGALVRVSEEHSLEEEQKRLGLSRAFPPGAAFAKNVLTRALGMSETVEVFIKPLETEEGDLTLLCSDGLTNYAEETSISAVLDDFSVSLERKVDILIQEANRGGGGDNVSVILLEVLKDGAWGKLKRKFLPGR